MSRERGGGHLRVRGPASAFDPGESMERKRVRRMRRRMRMRRRPVRASLTGSLALALAGAAAACGPPSGGPGEGGIRTPDTGPTLVVVVVVDQLRADLLERYDDHFSGGLRRLRDGGLRYVNATHDHGRTHTAAGHASIATGVYPFRHGIVANDWMEERDGRWRSVYSVEDPSSAIVGDPEAGGRSPRNLERDALPDWIRRADSRARVVSVSRKDRSAILMAGRGPGEVYWLDGDRGVFVTSRFYRRDDPHWVDAFNRRAGGRFFADSVWESRVPSAAARASRADTFPWEGDGVHTAFPHRAWEEIGPTPDPRRSLHRWIAAGPVVDEAVLALGRAAVEALDLGGRGHLDYLAVALSQTDNVGHAYGPLSREQLDNLLRLDRHLGDFLDFLDARVGEDRWILALTGDHGVLDIPEWLAGRGESAGRIGNAEMSRMMEAVAEAAPGLGPLPSGLRMEGAAVRAAPSGELARAAAALEAFPWVASARPVGSPVPASDSLAALEERSSRPDRRLPWATLGFSVRYQPGFIARARRGTTHGSPYHYDRWVPLVFYGPGFPAGVREERAATVDVAPTLADLLGVDFPDDLDGRPLLRSP